MNADTENILIWRKKNSKNGVYTCTDGECAASNQVEEIPVASPISPPVSVCRGFKKSTELHIFQSHKLPFSLIYKELN